MGVLLLLALGLVIFEVTLAAWTMRLLTHPPRRTYAWAVSRGRPGDPSELSPPREFRSFTFRSRGLDLPAWEIAGDAPDGPVAVFTHGWGESRLSVLPRLAALTPACARVIAWDLPGMGQAGGSCRLGTREPDDLLALLVTIDQPVVLAGFSLGAGVSIAAAARSPERIVGIVAEAPYRMPATPARAVLRQRGLPHAVNLPAALALLGMRFGAGVSWKGFDRERLACSLRVPMLVVVGEDDAVCPPVEARAIADAARARLLILPRAGHLDLWDRHADRLAGEIVAFIRETRHATTHPLDASHAPRSPRAGTRGSQAS